MRVSIARAPTSVPKESARNLEKRVRDPECARDETPVRWAQAEFRLHSGPGHGDADAIEVRDGRQRREKYQHPMAVLHWLRRLRLESTRTLESLES